jgi:hypothetical protein
MEEVPEVGSDDDRIDLSGMVREDENAPRDVDTL